MASSQPKAVEGALGKGETGWRRHACLDGLVGTYMRNTRMR